MLFMILCYDKEDGLELRKATRTKHLEYIAAAGDRLKFAGPILSGGESGTPIGSLLVLDAASEGAAILLAENDPYNKAGLFDRVVIHPWNGVLGSWLPKE